MRRFADEQHGTIEIVGCFRSSEGFSQAILPNLENFPRLILLLFGSIPNSPGSETSFNGMLSAGSVPYGRQSKRVPKALSDREHPVVVRLDGSNVLCLKAFRTFRDIELYSLAFLQAAEATSLNGGEMYENVFAILTAYKAIALGVVKPLHCSCFH